MAERIDSVRCGRRSLRSPPQRSRTPIFPSGLCALAQIHLALISLSVLKESLAGNVFRLALTFSGTFAVAKTAPKKEFVEPYSYHRGDEPSPSSPWPEAPLAPSARRPLSVLELLDFPAGPPGRLDPDSVASPAVGLENTGHR